MKLKNIIKEKHDDPYQWKLAGETVDGRTVRDDIPNTGSISASFDSYSVLKGIREVPMDRFTASGTSYSVSGDKRIKQLAEKIRESNEINPLIVVVDSEGPYILEGGHRLEALYLLRAKAFPALVVIDEDD
jgi:hypothetical protein